MKIKRLQTENTFTKTFHFPAASLLLFLISAIHSFAQVPSKEWDVRFGGSGSDAMYSIDQTTDDGYILGGDSDSPLSGDKSQNSQGSTDFWIIKTDHTGVKQWDKRFGGNAAEQLFGLQQTEDGGYFIAGFSNSGISGDKTQPSQGLSDYWVVKTDANGVKQWDARFGGTGDDQLRAAIQTSDGGYILAGHSNSGISGDKTQDNRGTGSDYWIVKINANGIKQWDARFGGTDDEELNAIRQTTDGGYIIGGWSKSPMSGDKTQGSQGSNDYWIVKTDANGIKQWDARYGGSDHEYLYSLEQTTDGGYILGGYSISGISGDKTQASQGGYDYWIVKTTATGVKQWDARFGGTGYDKQKYIHQTTDGGYLLAGWSESGISGDKTENSRGKSDYWLLKTDGNGAKQWDLRYGGAGDEKMHDVPQTNDGGYILAGYSYSGQTGDISQPSQGFNDYWIVKLSGSLASQTFYLDADNDGYGNPSIDTTAFSQPAGYVTDNTDCNDGSGAIHPGASDVCNGVDDNCNFATDENAIGMATITPGGTSNVCEGIPFLLTANNISGASYQWIKDAVNIPGATNKTLTTAAGGNFEITISNSFACTLTSAATTVNRIEYPVPVVSPAGLIQYCNAPVVILSANNQPGLSYQWYKANMAIPAATSFSYSTNKAGSFKVIEKAGGLCSATSAVTTVQHLTKPAASVTALGNLNICATGSVTLQANAGAGLTYKWMKGSLTIAGATNQSYTATTGGHYKVIVTGTDGCFKPSPVIIVTKSCKEEIQNSDGSPELSVYPNPASSHFDLKLALGNEENGIGKIEMMNLIGQVILSGSAEIMNGELDAALQVNQNIAEGLYLVRVITGDEIFTRQLVIEK